MTVADVTALAFSSGILVGMLVILALLGRCPA